MRASYKEELNSIADRLNIAKAEIGVNAAAYFPNWGVFSRR